MIGLTAADRPTPTRRTLLAGGCFWAWSYACVGPGRVSYSGEVPDPTMRGITARGSRQGDLRSSHSDVSGSTWNYSPVKSDDHYEQQGGDVGPSYRSAIFLTIKRRWTSPCADVAG